MKTVILDTPGQFRFDTTEAPAQITDGEALVRVRRVGICGTDLHAFRGRQPFFQYPRILGHELGVEIVEVGENEAGLQAGDLCAVEPYLNCGHCIACRKGKTNCCVSLQVLGVHTDGGMRELIKVPVHKLHPSKILTLEQLALVETLGIGAHAVDRAKIIPGEFALVIGAGPIGLSVMQFALQAGAQVITMDVNEARLAFCREQLGVQRTIVAGETSLAQIEEITSGDLPTVVFDATGNAGSMMQAFQYVSHGGRLVFVGLFQGEVTFNDPFFHRREMTLLSSRNSTSADFKRIIQLMERGEINTTPWVTHRCELEGMIEQFPSWLEPETGVIKAMVEI
jgi:2-desacetyl-2-hydroxyethyl bacteriochlorophyllide A dehydrogenase